MTTTPAPGVTPEIEALDPAALEAALDAAEIADDKAYRGAPKGSGVAIAHEMGTLAAVEAGIRAYLAALRAQPIPGTVGVQVLEWKCLRSGDWELWQANSIINWFECSRVENDPWHWRGPDRISHEVGSLDEAKAAAQADYERLILSCLTQGSQP